MQLGLQEEAYNGCVSPLRYITVGREVLEWSQHQLAIDGILVGSQFSNAYCRAEGWSEQFLQLALLTHNGQKYCKIDVYS